MEPLLQVRDLSVEFETDNGKVQAIDQVSFNVNPGETVCIVGESGSGKSVASMSILRLLEFENGSISSGEILYQGDDLLKKSSEEMRQIRGKDISIIFQEPMTALNPVFTIGKQLTEAILLHQELSKKKAWDRAKELLDLVGINDVAVRMKQYPHELSGGMRQRVMIAIALSCDPKLLIADEPTTALDVTIEAQILNLLNELKEKINMSVIFITHDMGVAAEISDRIVVMYAGKVVEEGNVYEVFDQPTHPYTKGLLQSIPTEDGPRQKKLASIRGTIPSINQMPSGCRFHPRCDYATEKCLKVEPQLERFNGRSVACLNYEDVIKEEPLTRRKEGMI
ncbi:ABC transporter ATP-binding protein [Alkalihalobacillus sp. AL-G]|uniref:ABC transporter ATP-binding protein n=1 Tax=Alkalihalobacillus sp. AL-G TaxID=2926399 RepID=UPI00272B18CB|nr:ABC transporter ATP-binding protein [Alkalihalobacillus sp. AL-G]WLD93056.1 ABC transporter ATP-binding protein [Alkalihalobacillus sp. AL-G]